MPGFRGPYAPTTRRVEGRRASCAVAVRQDRGWSSRGLMRRRKSGSSSGPITRVRGRFAAVRVIRQPTYTSTARTRIRSRYATKNLLPVNIRAIGRLRFVSENRRPPSRPYLDVLAYVVARLLLVGVVTAAILGVGHVIGIREFPVVVALLFAIVIALPLGIWVFSPLRRRATASIAVMDERRRRDREQLQSRLRGGGSGDSSGDGSEATKRDPEGGTAAT